MNGRILCQVCNCYVGSHPRSVSQHKKGRKHQNNKLLYGNFEEDVSDNDVFDNNPNKGVKKECHRNSQFKQLELLFPDKSKILPNLIYPSREIFKEVIHILYNILLEFDLDMDVSLDTIDVLIVYISYYHKLDYDHNKMIQQIPKDKFIYLFQKLILEDNIDPNYEIEKYHVHYTMNHNLENNNLELVQTQIVANYDETIGRYMSMYEEAKSDFDYQIKQL